MCRGTPAPVRRLTSKDADAAQSRYQEFVRQAITRDSEKADTDAAQSRYQEFVRRAITRDSEKKRQSVSPSQITVIIMLIMLMMKEMLLINCNNIGLFINLYVILSFVLK